MTIAARLVCLLPLASLSWSAEFVSGQGARAVLGQPSFSARTAGVSATSIAVVKDHLYAADNASHVLTFDLSRIPGAKEDPLNQLGVHCPVCLTAPVSSVKQSVLPGSSAISVGGKMVAAIDPVAHRVLLWRDVTNPSGNGQPDLVLVNSDSRDVTASPTAIVDPISVAIDGKRLFIGDAALHRVLVWNSVPSSADQPADAVLGQADLYSAVIPDRPTASSLSRPDALAFDGSNLFVSDGIDRRILMFAAGDVGLRSSAVINAASSVSEAFAPGTLIDVKGSALAETAVAVPDDSPDRLPLKLGGSELVVDGTPVPLLAVSPTEIRAQLPYDLIGVTSAAAYIRFQRSDGTVAITNSIHLGIASASPGLFAFSGVEPRAALVLHSGGAPVTPDLPARPGETITFWAGGLHATNDSGEEEGLRAGTPYPGPDLDLVAPVSAVLNGQSIEVDSAILPRAAVGIYEVRITLPRQFRADSGQAHLQIFQDGYSSNGVTFPIGQ